MKICHVTCIAFRMQTYILGKLSCARVKYSTLQKAQHAGLNYFLYEKPLEPKKLSLFPYCKMEKHILCVCLWTASQETFVIWLHQISQTGFQS